MIKKLSSGALLSLCLLQALQAAPVTFFGENLAPNPAATVSGAPVAARASFLSFLNNTVSSEGFSNFAEGESAPLALSFTGSTGTSLGATLNGVGFITNNVAMAAGRFDTTNATSTTPGTGNWWDTTGNFTLSFATAVSAFGFYGTDIGDFGDLLTLTLTDVTGAQSTLTLSNTKNAPNGSLLFFGFIDSTVSYTSIAFSSVSGMPGIDAFGFDDMVIADRGQIVGTPTGFPSPTGIPEPSSLVLVGLALAGLISTTRRLRLQLQG